MNLHLTGHHLEITPAIRDYVVVEARAHQPPLRPRDRRERHPVGGEARAEDRGQRARAGKDIHVRGARRRHVRRDRRPDRQARPPVLKHKETLPGAGTTARHQAHSAGLESPGRHSAAMNLVSQLLPLEPRPARPRRRAARSACSSRSGCCSRTPARSRARASSTASSPARSSAPPGLGRASRSRTAASRRSRSRCARSCAPPRRFRSMRPTASR